MQSNQVMTAIAIAATIIISGCASSHAQQTEYRPYEHSSQAYSNSYGSIESIQVVQINSNQSTTGTGAVAGALIGGLLGNQVGAGNGKAAATVAGVVGGAMVGNQIEKNKQPNSHDEYQIVVRLDNGNIQTFQQDSIVDMRDGDRVRVQDGRVFRY